MGKIFLLLTPSKTDERVPSQQVAPSTWNLTYRSTYVQTLPASLGESYWPVFLYETVHCVV